MSSVFLQKFLSTILILEVIYGRIVQKNRSDTYDVSVVSGIFLYWRKPPVEKEEAKNQCVNILQKELENTVCLLKGENKNAENETNSSSENS